MEKGEEEEEEWDDDEGLDGGGSRANQPTSQIKLYISQEGILVALLGYTYTALFVVCCRDKKEQGRKKVAN